MIAFQINKKTPTIAAGEWLIVLSQRTTPFPRRLCVQLGQVLGLYTIAGQRRTLTGLP